MPPLVYQAFLDELQKLAALSADEQVAYREAVKRHAKFEANAANLSDADKAQMRFNVERLKQFGEKKKGNIPNVDDWVLDPSKDPPKSWQEQSTKRPGRSTSGAGGSRYSSEDFRQAYQKAYGRDPFSRSGPPPDFSKAYSQALPLFHGRSAAAGAAGGAVLGALVSGAKRPTKKDLREGGPITQFAYDHPMAYSAGMGAVSGGALLGLRHPFGLAASLGVPIAMGLTDRALKKPQEKPEKKKKAA